MYIVLRYRISTSRNVILEEAKLTTIQERITALGMAHIIRSISRENTIQSTNINQFFENIKKQNKIK